jgi:hypothetical protein
MIAAIPTPKVCIGRKRGKNHGVVYAPDGRVIGRVFKASKIAAGAKGRRASFYTAVVILDGIESAVSLGTRHKTRASATAAILAFWRAYPALRIKQAQGRVRRTYSAPLAAALYDASAQFKYDNWQVCALSQRNLSDPRKNPWHTPIKPRYAA